MENPTFVDEEIKTTKMIMMSVWYTQKQGRWNIVYGAWCLRSDINFTIKTKTKARWYRLIIQVLRCDWWLRPCEPRPIYDHEKFKNRQYWIAFFYGNNQWQSLNNKRTGEFLASKTLREKFAGFNIMKSVLSLDQTRSALERSISAASKLKSELQTDLQM